MGTLQNSINQGLGTVTGAIAMGKHIKQQEESIAKQEDANKLAKINATDKAIDEYIQSGKDAINNMDETQALNRELFAIKRDQERFGSDPDSPQGMAFESSARSLQNALDAKEYQANLIKLRMKLQDESWDILGVNKEDLKKLNSPEEQRKIHKFKTGGNK